LEPNLERLLKFTSNNRKLKKLSKALGKKVYAFDIPAGWSCPGADICLSKAKRTTGKIQDGPRTKFRCYAASLEAAFPQARQLRWHNFDLLRTTSNIVELVENSLPSDTEIVRIHSSGDFFNLDYFLAWVQVARRNPKITFYGYTKRADFLASQEVPGNFNFFASIGGKFDHLTGSLKTATVVDSSDGLTIPVFDTDADSELHILSGGGDFALMIHGTQPKGFDGIHY
jgi:hypothetical protein